MNGDQMRKIVFFTLLAVACGLAAAQQKPVKTTYRDARRLYDQFEKALSRTLTWEKTTMVERVKALNDAQGHRNLITKAIGDFSQCSRAASAHVDFILNMNSLVAASQRGATVEAFDILSAMQSAEIFGNSRAPCYDEVEALDAPAKK